MTRTSITLRVSAPLEVVFQTVADIRNYAKAVPMIEKIEFFWRKKWVWEPDFEKLAGCTPRFGIRSFRFG